MRQRDAYFDNAKFILIAFVIFGHFFTSYIHHNEVIEALYKTIYSFHMPAFILLAGLFAKGFYETGYLAKITKRLLVPYLIFQTIYTIYYYFLREYSSFSIDFFVPQWSLWFLLSMFFWSILLLGFAKLKPSLGISLSIVIALLVGFIDTISNELSLSRTLVFFPFFLMGYHLNKDRLKQLAKPNIRLTSFLLILIVVVGFYINTEFRASWLYGSKPYSAFEAVTIFSMVKRFGFMCLSAVMVFSFLALVPRKEQFFTKWGKETLYVYLLQGFIIQFFRESEWKTTLDNLGGYLLLTIISLLVTIFLSSKLVTALTQPVIELKNSRFKQIIKNFQIENNKRKHPSSNR